jgi:hypothetical protein
MNAGVQKFIEAMQAMERALDVRDPIVLVRIDPPVGPHAGELVWVGADPPQDFPTIPPHWVHLSTAIELAGGGGQASELGVGWAKWSRPHKQWVGGDSAAREWVAHARALLGSALR